jgi:molecular chaperone GrpE
MTTEVGVARKEKRPTEEATSASAAESGTGTTADTLSDAAAITPGAADSGSAAAADASDVVVTPEAVEDPLVVVQRERDDLQDRLLRLAAEFDNFRKRTAREWQEHRKRAASDVLREMIELVDNFERALEAPAEDADGIRKGIELIHQQLLSSLQKFGIESVAAEGMEFDPQQHEALMLVETDAVESQHVVQVIQKGYALNGEILRPARVTVSK